MVSVGHDVSGIWSLIHTTVFLDENNACKLGDFGLSKILQSHDFASTYVGTPYYMSPEICAAERYSLYSDIWSLGCLLYELCAKEPPFNARTHIELFHKIKAGRVSPIPPVYSGELQKVITSCLQVNPNTRPSTVDLLNLPVVKLMRKEQEVVLLGQRMMKEKTILERKLKATEERLQATEADRVGVRKEIDDQVRREWEVKARLEIDRQVKDQVTNMKQLFETEVNKRVQQQMAAAAAAAPPPPRSSTPTFEISEPKDIPLPTTSGDDSSDFPSQTDLSSLSLDSPTATNPTAAKRTTRTPFTRARTMFAGNAAPSPMDITMIDPSPAPASLAGLSLSPRKVGKGLPSIRPKTNIFAAAAAAEDRWAPTSAYSPIISEAEYDDADAEDEYDDDLPVLPSPTRDPFKAANKRPGFARIQTLPAKNNRFTSTPNLFAGAAKADVKRPASAVPIVATSPARKAVPNPTSPARLRIPTGSKVPIADSGSPRKEGMLKAVMRNHLQGRTLVELAQARGAPVAVGGGVSKSDGAIKYAVGIAENEVPVWDPETTEDMPSPFLVRTRGMITRSR